MTNYELARIINRPTFSKTQSGKFAKRLSLLMVLFITYAISVVTICPNFFTSTSKTITILSIGLMLVYYAIRLSVSRIKEFRFDCYIANLYDDIKNGALDILDEELGLYTPSEIYQIKQDVEDDE